MKHFSHLHDLHVIQFPNQNNHHPNCFGCNLPLFGSCYTCSSPYCNFNLHTFCFELPQSTRLDSHPNHTLGLLYPPYITGGNCNTCGEYCNAFTYNCSLCNFNVHANCASLTQIDESKNDRERYIAMFLRDKILGRVKKSNDECSGSINTQNVWQYNEERARIKKMEMEMEERDRIKRMEMEMEFQRRRQKAYDEHFKNILEYSKHNYY